MSNPKIDSVKSDYGYENKTKEKLTVDYKKTTRFNKKDK